MVFKEIAFDMPLVNEEKKIRDYVIENNIVKAVSRSEYYNKKWKNKRIKFMNESEMLCEMIRKKLPKISTDKTWKLVVHCMSEEDYTPYCYNYDICEISVAFDFQKYNSSCDEDKVYLQLEALQKAINYANEVGVRDYEPILKICEELKTKRFSKNVSVWKTKRISKEYTAYIVLEHTLTNLNIFVKLKNKRGEVVYKKLIVQDEPSPICYHMKLGSIEVTSDNEIVLYNKLKTKVYRVSIPTDIYIQK